MESRRIRENAPLGPEFPKRSRWRRRLCWLAVFGMAALLLYASRPLFLPPVARFLNVSEPPRASEYVMILGGAANTRPFVAAALLKTGLARKALVPTIKCSLDNQAGITPPEHELVHSVLVGRGVAPEAVVFLNGACANTFDEARALADFLESHPQGSVTVVTTGYHTRRARWIFHKVLGDKASRVRFAAAPTDGYNETNWWRFEAGFSGYLCEYLKLAFYWVYY